MRENFPLSIIGTIVGATSMISSMRMVFGPLIGGMIFDRYGTYGWLRIGSFAVGLVRRWSWPTSAQRGRQPSRWLPHSRDNLPTAKARFSSHG